MKTIQIHPLDNVAVALAPLAIGEEGALQGIPRGHKITLCHIEEGDPITKYGCTIGYAREAISAGEWVHTHNVRTGLSEDSVYTYEPVAAATAANNARLRTARRAVTANIISFLVISLLPSNRSFSIAARRDASPYRFSISLLSFQICHL